MTNKIGPIARRPVLRFWLIATGLEIVLAAALLALHGDVMIDRALQVAGIDFNTDLITAIRLCVAFPGACVGVGLSLAQVAAPDLAVLAVARSARAGLGSLRSVTERLRFWSPETGFRRGLRVWGQMVLVFAGMSLATAALDRWWLRSSEYSWTPPASVWALAAGLAVAMFLDAGAVFEENGWRGYALPLLLRQLSPVRASVVLGLAWAAWHYPVKYNALTDYGPRGVAYLAAFTLKIVLLTVVMTYFWQRTGQSTIIAIAMHGLSNDSLRLQGQLIGDSLRLSVLSELTICGPLAVVALVLMVRTRGRLGAPDVSHA
jgi:uncharacterized protein